MENLYLVLIIIFGLISIMSFVFGIFNEPKFIEISMACFLFSGLFYFQYNSIENKNTPPVQYENEIVSGDFLGESSGNGKASYRAGRGGYTIRFNLDGYGNVGYYNISINREDDSGTGVNYNRILSLKKVCLDIKNLLCKKNGIMILKLPDIGKIIKTNPKVYSTRITW